MPFNLLPCIMFFERAYSRCVSILTKKHLDWYIRLLIADLNTAKDQSKAASVTLEGKQRTPNPIT